LLLLLLLLLLFCFCVDLPACFFLPLANACWKQRFSPASQAIIDSSIAAWRRRSTEGRSGERLCCEE
jgi:hypothetical protein